LSPSQKFYEKKRRKENWSKREGETERRPRIEDARRCAVNAIIGINVLA
jgi:hypothetical protein